MIIQEVIDNLKTAIEALTWQPTGNTGATSFVNVYTAPVIDGTSGSPWCYIHDQPGSIIKRFTRGTHGDTGYEKPTNIGIFICTTYGTDTPEEDARRLRYAQEAVEAYIKGAGNLFDAGFTQGWNYTSWELVESGQTNVEIRKLNLINQHLI